jgi:hypothetical protein
MRTLAISEINYVGGGTGDHTTQGSIILRDHTDRSNDFVVRYGHGGSVWMESGYSCTPIRSGANSSGSGFNTYAAAAVDALNNAANAVTNWVRSNCQVNGSVGIGGVGLDLECTLIGGQKKN